jgi:hypothetical protein
VDSVGSGLGLVAASCEHGDEQSSDLYVNPHSIPL